MLFTESKIKTGQLPSDRFKLCEEIRFPLSFRFPVSVSLFLLTSVPLFLTHELCAGESGIRREWHVDGVLREALIYEPSLSKTQDAPVIFIFHGHGGTMSNAARLFAYQKLWPEAICVYPQGLKTVGRLTDPEGNKSGWQAGIGGQQDRDLKFFDAILSSLKQDHHLDDKRIYATGHSNGGGFTYVLWAARGEVFAAVASSGATAAGVYRLLMPKPVLHVAGENDPLVKFAWQRQTIDALRRLNQCGEGQKWAEWCTQYPSTIGSPVVSFIHPGGHAFPALAASEIVRFFKEHVKP